MIYGASGSTTGVRPPARWEEGQASGAHIPAPADRKMLGVFALGHAGAVVLLQAPCERPGNLSVLRELQTKAEYGSTLEFAVI